MKQGDVAGLARLQPYAFENAQVQRASGQLVGEFVVDHAIPCFLVFVYQGVREPPLGCIAVRGQERDEEEKRTAHV